MSTDERTDPDEGMTAVEIIATVSHELRSPLTSIKGFTSLLLSRWDGIADDRKKEMLEAVRHDADRVTRMLTELLDISRLEAGRLHLSPRPLEVGPIIRSVVDKVAMVEPELDATVDVADDVGEVVADADKVEQVLTNLVENAAKYGSPHGLRITARATDDGVAVAVADTGAGIPAEDLVRVFERFYRREEGRPTGTGLGLWISRGLVEAHGGTLVAESVEGQGSTFTFTLPRVAPER
jgi:signal transduction histidine kinase